MGNCYYLVSPATKRVLSTGKREPQMAGKNHWSERVYADGATLAFPVCIDPDRYARDYSPCLAAAANIWLMHYGGDGMWIECDAAFSYELDYRGGPLPEWCSWPEDDLFKLRDWLFGR